MGLVNYTDIDLRKSENVCTSYTIGSDGDSNSEALRIFVPPEYLACKFRVKVGLSDGQSQDSPMLDYNYKGIVYILPKSVLRRGEIVISIKAVNTYNDFVKKLFERTFVVTRDAETYGEIPDVAYAELDERISQLESERVNLTNEESERFISDLGIKIPQGADLSSYLFEANYTPDNYDYEFAEANLSERYIPAGACSAVRKGFLVGRNFDWNFDEVAEVVIRTASINGRFATLGVSRLTNLTLEKVLRRRIEDIEFYKLLPFMLLDGVNENGVYCSINVTAVGDRGLTTGTNPGSERLCGLALVRFVLDYSESAAHAMELLQGMDIWFPHGSAANEEFHYLVCDKEEAYVVEFVDNSMVYSKCMDYEGNPAAIITNFSLDSADGSQWFDGTYTEREEATEDTEFFKPSEHPMGVERFDILKEAFPDIVDKDSMKSVMQSVKYTNAYNRSVSPFWYSEFSADYRDKGYENLSWGVPVSSYERLVSVAIGSYEYERESGSRTSRSWQTTHTAIYDLEKLTLCLFTQEDYEREYVFGFKEAGAFDDSELRELIGEKLDAPDKENAYPGYVLTLDEEKNPKFAERHTVVPLTVSNGFANYTSEDISRMSKAGVIFNAFGEGRTVVIDDNVTTRTVKLLLIMDDSIFGSNQGDLLFRIITVRENAQATVSEIKILNDLQSDWATNNPMQSSYIQNKPTKLSQFQNDLGFVSSQVMWVTYDGEQMSKTFSEIKAAHDNGISVKLLYNSKWVFDINIASSSSIVFSLIYGGEGSAGRSDSVSVYIIELSNTDTVKVFGQDLQLTELRDESSLSNSRTHYPSSQLLTSLLEGVNGSISSEASQRQSAISEIQSEIDTLVLKSDVVDLTETHESLLEYDTSGLFFNDIILVISDETHEGKKAYYRWERRTEGGEWVFLNTENTSYSKSEIDDMMILKANASNVYSKSEADSRINQAIEMVEIFDFYHSAKYTASEIVSMTGKHFAYKGWPVTGVQHYSETGRVEDVKAYCFYELITIDIIGGKFKPSKQCISIDKDKFIEDIDLSAMFSDENFTAALKSKLESIVFNTELTNGNKAATMKDIEDKVDYPDDGEEGDVLKKKGTGVEWGKAASPLPDPSSLPNGKILKTVNGGWAAGDDNVGLSENDKMFSFAVDENGNLIVSTTSEAEEFFDFEINSSGELIIKYSTEE